MEGYPGQGTMAAHSPGRDRVRRDTRLAVCSRGQRCHHLIAAEMSGGPTTEPHSLLATFAPGLNSAGLIPARPIPHRLVPTA